MNLTHLDILEKLNLHGHEAYIVGGAVRDRLLDLPVKDYDMATSASPDQVEALFSGSNKIFSQNGAPVVRVQQFEVASFRKDVGLSRHGCSFVPGNLEDDAHRRDFTVNALYETRHGTVVDPTGQGLTDIKLGRLRFIGNADKRILEDPTRILRFFRLAAQKGFSMLDWGSAAAIASTCVALDLIAKEQIGRELRKLMAAKGASTALREMFVLGVLELVLPEIAALNGVNQNQHHQEGDVFEHTMRVVKAASEIEVPEHQRELITMAALFHDAGKLATAKPNDTGGYSFHGHELVSGGITLDVLDRLPVFNKSERETIVWLVVNHMRIHGIADCSRKKRAALLRHKDAKLLVALMQCDTLGRVPCAAPKLRAVLDCINNFYDHDKTLTDLGINGKLLLELGEPAGKALGEKLQIMSNILDKDPTKTREELLKAVGLEETANCSFCGDIIYDGLICELCAEALEDEREYSRWP